MSTGNTMFTTKSFSLGQLLLVLATSAMSTTPVTAVEIRLRSDSQPAGAVVLLGDVAQITASSSAERRRLEAIELFPAPSAGGRQTVRRREIADTLSLRGIDWSETQLVGSSVIEIELPTAKRQTDADSLPENTRRRVERLVRNAIVEFLRGRVAERMPWDVKPTVSDDMVRAIVDGGSRSELRVVSDDSRLESYGDNEPEADGRAPVADILGQADIERWIGQQRFAIELLSDNQRGAYDVAAIVSLPPRVVVVNRALPTGTVLYAEDLSLAHVERAAADVYYAIDQVAGSELTRPVAAGQVLGAAQVRSPLMVRRGDVVDVFSYAAGIQVKTLARVTEDGARGDMVMVESIKNRRDIYRARVTGTQRVEVYARGRTVAAQEVSPASASDQMRLRSARRTDH
jgi:flagella basal body P-ring formation protein FlgA